VKPRAALKSTEVGVIPADWRVVTLGDLDPYITSGSRGWAEFYSETGSAFVRITNMSRETIRLDLDDLRRVKLPTGTAEGKRTELRDDDVLISITADVGIVSHVEMSVPKPAYINQHIALVRLDPSKASGHFVSYFLAAPRAQKLLRGATDQGAKTGMGLESIRKIRIPLPLLAEQRAIAAALGDNDALIASLDQLIAKKRNIKLAAAQLLLTGQLRLPGFTRKKGNQKHHDLGSVPDDWDVRPLLHKTVRVASGQVSPTYEPYRSMTLVAPDHVESCTGRLLTRVSASDQGAISGKYAFEPGDIIYSKIRPYLRKATLATFQGLCSADMYPLTPVADVSSAYVLAVLLGERFSQFAESVSVRSGIPKVNRDDLAQCVVAVPPYPEQVAIAEVLTDMDAEIAALEARRDKTKALKQAMMQELLTGRTRLV
jgi:type I restriction enzyme, S subunit